MKKHKTFTPALGVIVICGLVFAALEATNITNLIGSNSAPKTSAEDYDAKTTSTAPSAQPDFSEGDPEKEPGNTLNENRGSALVKETPNTNVKTSNPITSDTGEITVYSPGKNTVITAGTVLSGTSSLAKIEYRVIDSISGVIATGSLPVRDGKFSGKISFDTNAPEGRIDIFATKSDFTEYSYIEIPIKFKG